MSIDSELKKGAFVNFIGVIGKMAAPIFLVVVNRFFGPDVFGIYITANIAVEIIIAFLTSGFKDGALIFVARFADDKGEQKDLYNSLANAFAWSIGFSILVIAIGLFFGNHILEFAYKEDFNEGLSIMFRFMLFAIPMMAFERVVLAATQGLKIMKYDALSNGWLRPLALLLFATGFWFIQPNLTGMALAYLSTQTLLFLVSLWIYTRELSWLKLYHGFGTFRVDKELLDFAIPQNINMTLNRFITGIDVLMLPAFGFSPTIVGFYGAGSMIIREVKAIKMVFSTAFAPFIVRMHKEGEYEDLSHNFSKTAGWIATLAIPALLLLAIFKGDLLAIIHPEYGGNSAFMFFLLPIPYLYCSFSLAGNIVAMTGYSKLTLINSLIVSVANILMNLFLIPTLGVVGAALASSVATLILHSFELAEARWVANARLYIRDIYKPHLSGLIAALAMAAGITFVPWFTKGIMEQAVLAVIVLGIFGAFLGSDYIRRVQKKVAKAT